MQTPLQDLAKLADRARQEAAPRVEVADEVLAILHERRLQPDRSLFFVAAAAVAAASIAIILSVSLYTGIADPLWTLFQTVAVMTP